MNEEAIKDGYNYFVQTGYDGTLEDYKQLLQENNEAFNDTYKYFVNTGYNGTVEEFQVLIGNTAEDAAEKKNSSSTVDVEEMLVSGIPAPPGSPTTSESSESNINQDNTAQEGAQPQPQSEQNIDQTNQQVEGEVDPDEQAIDQDSDEALQQELASNVKKIEPQSDETHEERLARLLTNPHPQTLTDEEILQHWANLSEKDREFLLEKTEQDEERAKDLMEQVITEQNARGVGALFQGMSNVMNIMGIAAVEGKKQTKKFVLPENQVSENQIIEPQKIVARSESFGGGKALLNTIKNIFKGTDSSGDRAYKRKYYHETESTGKRVDEETKGYIESKDPFEQSLQHIDTELIENTEENVIPLMEYHFGDYGFRFEQADAAGDGMNVYALVYDGDGGTKSVKHYVNLDRLWSKQETADALKNFLKKHRQETNLINQQEKGFIQKEYKFHDEAQVERTVKKVTERENKLRDGIKEYFRQLQAYNSIKHLPPDEVIYIETATSRVVGPFDDAEVQGETIATTPSALLKDIQSLHKKLNTERSDLITAGQQLDRDIGLWYMLRGQQGTASGGFFQNMTAGGGSDIGAFGMDFVIDAGVSIAHAIDEDATGGLTPDQMKKQIKLGQDQRDGEGYERQEASPFSQFANRVTRKADLKKGMTTGVEAAFDWATGQESRDYIDQKMARENIYVEDHPFSDEDLTPEEKGWWEWVGKLGFYGAARSIPAMVGQGPNRILNMGGQVYTHLQKEMAGNPEFDDISENEKKLFSIPLAAVVGVLENLGFRNMKQMTSISSKVLMNVLGKGGKDVTGRTFAQVVKAEVNNLIAQGVIRVGNAGIAEFETGFLQELADITFKTVYNTVKDHEAFATPQSTEEFFGQLMVGATSEMIGGFVIGTPGAIVYAARDGDFTQVNDETFKVFDEVHNQKPVRDAFVAKIKEKILSGDITKQEGERDIKTYDQITGVMNQIPTDLPLQSKKKLLGNLLRQQELRDYIDKYNKQLTKKQQRELAELENQVESIIREGDKVKTEDKKEKDLTDQAMHVLINSGVENPTPEEVNKKKEELREGTASEIEVTDQEARESLEADNEINAQMEKRGMPNAGQKLITQDAINKRKEELRQEKLNNLKKQKTDAVQESSTTEVDVQVQTQDGGPVGTGNTTGTSTSKSKVKSKTDTKTKTKKKVEPATDLEQEVGDLAAAVSEDTGQPIEQDTETTTTSAVEVDTENNTVNVTTSEGSTVSLPGGQVSENVQYTSTDGTGSQNIAQRLIEQAKNAGKAVKKLLPKVNIVLHATEDAYNQAVSQKSKGTRGTFSPATNTIHVNTTIANSRTIPHEIMHAVLLKTLGIDTEIQKVTNRMLKAAIKGVKDPKVKRELQEFAKNYEAQEQNEEQVAELFGMLADNYTQLDKTAKNTVKRWLQIVASKLGLPVNITKFTKNDKDIIDFFNTVAGKVRTGEEVQESDVEILTKTEMDPESRARIKEIDSRIAEIETWMNENILDDNNKQIKENIDKTVELATERAKLLLEKQRLEYGTETAKKKKKKRTQKDKVKEVVSKEGEATIKRVAKETGLPEPTVRRILGQGAKKGDFNRVAPGVYTIKGADGTFNAVINSADALTEVKKLIKEGVKFDMIFLDPPYYAPGQKGGNRNLSKFDTITPEQFAEFVNDVTKLLRTEDSQLIFMFTAGKSSKKVFDKYKAAIDAMGLKSLGVATFQKLYPNKGTPHQLGGHIMSEFIFAFNKSGKLKGNKRMNDYYAFKHPQKGVYPTSKPSTLLEAIIEVSTEAGELIFDPFAGSGSTVKAALKKGRKVVALEKSKEQTKKIKEEVTPKKKKTPIVPGHHISLINELLRLAGYKGTMSATEHAALRKTPEGRALDKLISKLLRESKTYEEAVSKLTTVQLPFGMGSEAIAAMKEYQQSQDVWTDEEIEEAYAEQEAEGKALQQEMSGVEGGGVGYVMQKIHEYFHGITQKDFDAFGDPNLRQGNRALNFLLRRNASPLDGQAQELSELAGVEITPQDFIDYMLDRSNNPGKYAKAKEKNQKAGLDKLIQMYQMNPKGFIGPNIYSLKDLETWAGRLGFGIGKARVRDKNAYDYGRLTGYYLTKNGRMFNPRAQEKNQKSINEKNQKTFNKEDSPLDIINTARDQNFTDAAIRDYLTRVRKFPKREIDKLMKVHDEVLKTVPKSLGNIEGGMNKGLDLYNKIFKKYYKLQRENIKSKVKKSQEEIMDETIDYLKNLPEFKKLNTTGTDIMSTQQRVLEMDIARALGGKQSSDLSAAIKNSRLILNSKKIGLRELQEVQRELRNFLRRVLPKDIYTKSEVNKLIRKIGEATPENIQNIQNEILEFAAEKNNIRLEESIEKLLNPKDRIKINNILKGVKIDDATRKRIERIRKRLNPKGGLKTEDQVLEYLAKLQEEYNDINENPAKKEADYEALADLQIVMSLVNAQNLMENTDISKVASLSKVEAMLKEIIVTGKTLFKEELKKAHLEYRRQFEEVYKDISGRTESFKKQAIRELKEEGIENPTPDLIQDKITDIIEGIKTEQPDLNDAASKKNRVSGIALKKRAQNLMNSISRTLGNIMGENSDMFTLMDKISKLPANLFEGITQKEVTERIDAASRLFKERMLMNEAFIVFKWQELFGKKYKKKVATFTKRVLTGIYKNAEAVQKAKDNYANNPTPENEAKLADAIAKNEQELSPNQMYYLYNQYKDPRNHPGFEKQFGPEYKRIMQEMTDLLTNEYAELKEFADWQVDILFPMLYQHYNEAYKDIYRIDMPYNVNYAGMVYRELPKGEQQDAGIDLLSGTPQYHNTVSTNSTKMRQDNKRAIRKDIDGTNALFTYMRDMEYFAAYARPVSDINKIFTNPIIYDTIKRLHGQKTNDLIDAAIKKIANKGMSQSNEQMDQAVNVMQDLFILSRLGINPVVTLKQLTSFVTYANDIGFTSWMKNAALSRFFKKGQSVRDVWKEIAENSVYLQDRQKQSITKAIEAYTDERMIEVMPETFGVSGHTKESLINILMYTTRLGDIGAIYLGGVPNYVFYKQQALKAGKTEQEAIDYAIKKFERDTKRTQQSTDLQDRDYRQNKDAINRALNMFLTTPKQYLRKEVYAIRNLYRLAKSGGKEGKGTVGENMRTFITYHVVMPMFFQYVANGFPGLLADWDEEDKNDLWRAAILGNINALFIYGEFAVKFADLITGKPQGFLEFKNLPILTQGEEIFSKFAAYRDAKDPVKKQEKLMAALRETAQITGLPVNNLHKIFTNLEALAEGGEDPAKMLLRLFNFSEYQIYSEEERENRKKEMMREVNQRTRQRHGTDKKKKTKTKPKSNGNPMERVNPMHSTNPMMQDNPMKQSNPMLD